MEECGSDPISKLCELLGDERSKEVEEVIEELRHERASRMDEVNELNDDIEELNMDIETLRFAVGVKGDVESGGSFVGGMPLEVSTDLYVMSYDFDRCWMELDSQGEGLSFNEGASWRLDKAFLHVPGFQLGAFAGGQRFELTLRELPREERA